MSRDREWNAKLYLDIPLQDTSKPPRRHELFDLYLSQSPQGLAIYIHGGGWHQGTSDRPSGYRSMLAAGLSVASIQYRYSDDGTLDEIVQDVERAISGAIETHREYAGRPVPALVWGISAGGHLAITWAQHFPHEHLNVRAIASWCGPSDLVSLDRLEGVKPHCTEDVTTAMSKLKAREADPDATLRRWSPIESAARSALPHFFVHGDDDGLVPIHHSIRMHEALLAEGVESELFVVPGGSHAMPPHDWEGIQRTISFFRKYTKDG
jgi:acetyl esterase/lipase